MSLKYLTTVSIIFGLSIANPAFSKSLDVPFTVQAPEANWNQPWQDTCEETAIAMVDYFYTDNTFTTTKKAKEAIMRVFNIKEKFIGISLDENAETVVSLINNYLPWEAYIKQNPTLDDIKKEIDNGRPVILPVHGKYLYNPYFRNGGPDYHSIVISGYDDEKSEFIAQEPGTWRGLDFRYSYGNIMNAIHDFLPDLRTKFSEKLAVFTRPKIIDSAGSPINDEVIPPLTGTLVKSPADPKVYLINNNIKRHILNEQVFIRYGWNWLDIFTVPDSFIEKLETGAVISQ